MTSIEQIRERHDEYQGDLEMIMHEAEAYPSGEYSGEDLAHKDRATLLAVIEQVEKLQRLSVAGTEQPSMSHFIFKDTEWVRWDEIEELLK
jgi:hypothetical protein